MNKREKERKSIKGNKEAEQRILTILWSIYRIYV